MSGGLRSLRTTWTATRLVSLRTLDLLKLPDRRMQRTPKDLGHAVQDGLRAVCHLTDSITRKSDSQDATNFVASTFRS